MWNDLSGGRERLLQGDASPLPPRMRSLLGMSRADLQTWLRTHHLLEALKARVCLPLLPLPDNFTPPTRMPWGGTKILGTYKDGLPIREEKRYPIVGESWEISADPIAPSQFHLDLGKETLELDLIQVLTLFPEHILGPKVAEKFQGYNPILAKIIDSADHLSVQVHPSDDYAGLGPSESGKPESWYILEAEEGCGLYLGLREGVSKTSLRRAIEEHEDVSRYLNFVEVQRGDFFVIDAGTIHAIGAGVTLIEPQKIAPHKSGKTFRLWDWNRTYDAQGHKDPQGKPRELHIEEAFQIINFDAPRGEDFINQIQPRPQVIQQQGRSIETLLVETENFGVSQIALESGDTLEAQCVKSFHGLILYAGSLEIASQGKPVATMGRGQAALLPAALQRYTLRGTHARAVKVYYPEQYLL
ncbi:hypothetical protein GF339_19495 [candidate division KSB3 bacterium]|uniref:Phosphomannose isomerase type I catalytic domain-containing protein n=1 Tax=candidate division KSB3 bacterium TaxID=2044937 RepID=A0A9D5JZ42_9BACT|nr:hypothetical protein [candidate division KSB3 bacterium]MBD3326778.1 hypothetical protein [candidate division KSB3 bacterium]